jgi:lysophospholipase L1-like esterase
MAGRRVPAALVGLAMAALVPLAVAPAAGAATGPSRYYVSLGDSYSVGFQPGVGATPGYAAYVAHRTRLRLVNFGCGGATTTSILDSTGCPDRLPHTPGAVAYPTTTQAAAAEAFIRAHRADVRLITVSIGGNDVTACAVAANPVSCVATVVKTINQNVSRLVVGLRAAAGPQVRIIGLTYPDVILGEYVYPSQPPSSARVNLAQLSVAAFKVLINPALAKAYGRVHGSFVDVTAATGAYTPLTRTVVHPPYGSIPVPVASVCTLTWYCSMGNIHATTAGYDFIGRLVVARYRAGAG